MRAALIDDANVPAWFGAAVGRAAHGNLDLSGDDIRADGRRDFKIDRVMLIATVAGGVTRLVSSGFKCLYDARAGP